MAQTQPKQNFHADSEAGINRQINVELYASYVYQSMVRISCLFIASSTTVAGYPYFGAILISVQSFHLVVSHSVCYIGCFIQGG